MSKTNSNVKNNTSSGRGKKKIKLDHCYRFALIGSTSSGKTCMLARLAMGRCGGDRFTSIFQPTEMKPLTPEEINNLSKNDEQTQMRYNFQVGSERIENAKLRLQNGQRPEPTANESVRPMITLKMTEDGGRGDYYVWTEDYPGELLNTEDLQDPESHSTRLKNNLLNYDGLIIVVDTFGANADERRINNDIENLMQFFSSITVDKKQSGHNMPIPVVVILSKWDRASQPIEFNDPAKEQQKLQQFLSGYSIYKELLKTASGSQSDLGDPTELELCAGVAWNNTAIFPTSAFGRSIIHGQDENPDPNCLESFSLVEPFFWLAQRCDEIHIKDWESRMQKWWLSPLKVRRIYKEAQKEQNRRRIAPKSNYGQRLQSVLCKSFRLLTVFYLVLLLVLAIAGDGAWSIFNNYRVGIWEDAINNPKQSIESLGELHDTILAYKQNPHNGWLAPRESIIQEDIKRINKTIDDLKWQPVQVAIENAEKAKEEKNPEEEIKFRNIAFTKAAEYLKIHHNGPHAAKANGIINDYNKQQEIDYWNNYVLQAEQNTEEQKKRAEEYLSRYPQGQFVTQAQKTISDYLVQKEKDCWAKVTNETDDIKKKDNASTYLELYPNGNHVTEAQAIIKEYFDKADWIKAKLGYDKQLEGDNISQIITSLKHLINNYGTGADRCGPLVTAIPKLIEEKINSKSIKSNAKQMIDECKDAALVLRSLEELLRPKNEKKLADEILTCSQNMEAQKSKYIDKYDEELYKTVQSRKDERSCGDYINTMESLGKGAMTNHVVEYKEYLIKSRAIQDVQLSFDLFWGHRTDIYRVRGTISANGKDVYNDKSWTYKNATKELAKDIQLDKIDPAEKIKIEVRFISEGNKWGNQCTFGEGTDSYYVTELIKGRELQMNDPYGYRGKLKITAKTPQTPKEPELPSWSKK